MDAGAQGCLRRSRRQSTSLNVWSYSTVTWGSPTKYLESGASQLGSRWFGLQCRSAEGPVKKLLHTLGGLVRLNLVCWFPLTLFSGQLRLPSRRLADRKL